MSSAQTHITSRLDQVRASLARRPPPPFEPPCNPTRHSSPVRYRQAPDILASAPWLPVPHVEALPSLVHLVNLYSTFRTQVSRCSWRSASQADLGPRHSWVSLSDHTLSPLLELCTALCSPERLETPRVPSVFVLLASASRERHIIATQRRYGARKFLWAGGSFHSVN